jgi:hypothetical protein
MIGSWRWNATAATLFAAMIFLLSFSHNPIQTAGYRAGITFAILFSVTFAVRWLLGQALASAATDPAGGIAKTEDEHGKGQTIDVVTPDEEEGAPLQFAPLTPPKLTRTEESIDPERLAEALRHMSEK